jgi:hypothetical protein
LSDPVAIRKQAILEAQQTLGTLGTDMVFISLKRTLLEALVKEAPDTGPAGPVFPARCPYVVHGSRTMDVIGGLPQHSEMWMIPRVGWEVIVDSVVPGGSLGGESATGTMDLTVDLDCTGELAAACSKGKNIRKSITVNLRIDSAPRSAPICCTFDTTIFYIYGQITGDPDFDLLRIEGGTDFGLPSPGHTTLTRLPSGNWAVDSFFDITYRIDFVGAPGGPLDGLSGSTAPRTLRMTQRAPLTPPHYFGLAHREGRKTVMERDIVLDHLKITTLDETDTVDIEIGGAEALRLHLQLEEGEAISCSRSNDDGTIQKFTWTQVSGPFKSLSVEDGCPDGGDYQVEALLDGVVVDSHVFSPPLPPTLATGRFSSGTPESIVLDTGRRRDHDLSIDSFFDIFYDIDPATQITGRPPVTADQVRVSRSLCVCDEGGGQVCGHTSHFISVGGGAGGGGGGSGGSAITRITELEAMLQTFGLLARSSGGGTLTVRGDLIVTGGTLLVSNIGSSGQDGVSLVSPKGIDVDTQRGLVVDLEPIPMHRSGMELTVTARDSFGNPEMRMSYGRRSSTISDLHMDLSPSSGGASVDLFIFDNGTLVGSMPVSELADIEVMPGPGGMPQLRRAGKVKYQNITLKRGMMAVFDRDGLFSVGGSPALSGDECRVVLDGSGSFDPNGGLSLTGTTLGSFTITAATPVDLCELVFSESISFHAGKGRGISISGQGPATECRMTATKTIEATFSGDIEAIDGLPEIGDDVLVTFGSGLPTTSVDNLRIQGGTLSVDLTNAPGGGTAAPDFVTILLTGLTCTNNVGINEPLPDTTLHLSLYPGDVTGNCRTTSADVNKIRASFGAVTDDNFRADLDGDGVVDEMDVNLAKGGTLSDSAVCP